MEGLEGVQQPGSRQMTRYFFLRSNFDTVIFCVNGMIPHEDIQVLNVSLLATNPPSVRLIDSQLPRRGGFKVPVGREVWGF